MFWFFLDFERITIFFEINDDDDFNTIYLQLFKKRKDDSQQWNKNHNCWSYACMDWNSGPYKWIFVEYKIKENVWMNTNFFIQEVPSVMFQ